MFKPSFLCLLLVLLLSSSVLFGQTAKKSQARPTALSNVSPSTVKPSTLKPAARPRPVSRSPWTFQSTWEWINGLTYRDAIESQINPYNRVAEIDRYGFRMDFTSTFKANYQQDWKFILVPRITATAKDIYYSNTRTSGTQSGGKADLLDANVEYSFTPNLYLNFGLQNYQWGPAEFFSPSNGLVHFNLAQKSVLWREKGKVLTRLNWSIGKSWSTVFICECISNQEPGWIADIAYNPKTMLKIEYRSAKVSNRYFGLSAGTMENTQPFTGMYANLSLNDSLSIYFDGRLMNDPKAYYPVFSTPFYQMNLGYKEGSQGLQTIAQVGVRWESERWDIRLEYLANSMGYNSSQFRNALSSVTLANSSAAINIQRLLRSGMELPGREYFYLSYRLNNFWRDQSQMLSLRHFLSGLDGSGVTQLNWEKGFGDRWTFYLEGTVNNGSDNSEFILFDHGALFLGAKAVF